MSEEYTTEYFMQKLGKMREDIAGAKKGYKSIEDLMSRDIKIDILTKKTERTK